IARLLRDLRGALERARRLVGATRLEQGPPEVAVRRGVVGTQAQGLAQGVGRLGRAAELEERPAEAEPDGLVGAVAPEELPHPGGALLEVGGVPRQHAGEATESTPRGR